MHRLNLSSFTLSLLLPSLAGCGAGDDKSTETTTGGGSQGTEDPSSTSAASTTTGATSSGTTVAVEPPAAPTDLSASILEGGVHLIWKDASDNEDNFVLENKAAGDVDFSLVIELPFDSVTYHDIDVTAATEYTYRVKAVNAGGESLSNEVMIQVP